MTRVYYKEAVGAFVVFDVTRGSTFEAVSKWKHDLDSKVKLANGSPIPSVLLANKCDQKKESSNNTALMENFCKETGFLGWFETSAKVRDGDALSCTSSMHKMDPVHFCIHSFPHQLNRLLLRNIFSSLFLYIYFCLHMKAWSSSMKFPKLRLILRLAQIACIMGIKYFLQSFSSHVADTPRNGCKSYFMHERDLCLWRIRCDKRLEMLTGL